MLTFLLFVMARSVCPEGLGRVNIYGNVYIGVVK